MRPLLTALAYLVLVNTTLAGEKTPGQVFDMMYDAYRKEGAKGFMAHLTRDSQKALTGGTLLTLHGVRTYLSKFKETADHVKILDELMKRQGIDAAKLKSAADKVKPPRSADEAIANMSGFADWIKDGPAFVTDAITTINGLEQVPPIELVPRSASLEDLKVSGETAQGSIVYGFGKDSKTDPIFFRREGGMWRIDFVRGIRESFAKGMK